MPARKRAAGHPGAKRTRRWSAQVAETSDALDLEPEVFKRDAAGIARSLKRSAERSRRRKGTVLSSAMSMLNFFMNRAGKNLAPARKPVLEEAKVELRRLVGPAPQKGNSAKHPTH